MLGVDRVRLPGGDGGAAGSNRWIRPGRSSSFEPSECGEGPALRVPWRRFVYERVRRPFGLRQTVALLGPLGLAPAALVFIQARSGARGIVPGRTNRADDSCSSPGFPWQQLRRHRGRGPAVDRGRRPTAVGSAAGIQFLHGLPGQDRLTAFPAPERRPERRPAYQVNQAVIAVGSGEEGRAAATMRPRPSCSFLPEAPTPTSSTP